MKDIINMQDIINIQDIIKIHPNDNVAVALKIGRAHV